MPVPFMSLRDYGVQPTHSGKVRETVDLGDELFMVTTDRISAFDCVLPSPIPGKGQVLNRTSAFWLKALDRGMPTHYLTHDAPGLPQRFRNLADVLEGRWMLVRKADRIPVECVVRGYLAGSGLQEYREKGSINGIALPAGIPAYGRIPEPIFTPTTKEDVGHDRPITGDELASIVGSDLARDLREASLRIFAIASAHALSRGLVLVDTKFEFGWIDGRLALIDEALTPDSSRWWDVGSLGAEQPESLDKEFVRAYLKTLAWDRNPPAPSLPASIIDETLRRYRLVHDRLGADGPLPNLFG